MIKNLSNSINLILILVLIYLTSFSLKPSNTTTNSTINGNFQMNNAIDHLEKISKEPHYIGSTGHQSVQEYIVKELQELGLQVDIQKTTIANSHNTYIQVENIVTRIKGSNRARKSLLVMSHYDSVPYASLGAADAGSGVVVILEGIRAFLENNTQPENDIIVLITDAEEIGLLGAKAFVNKHPWSQNVGAVLNFEARGSAGGSYMLMETNTGNHELLENYKASGIQYSNSNSLGYSIYKMLPNDTDLSVFRKDKDIVGFNFAFIGNHFNYHTVLDNAENLSLDSLAHQASYLMPMLNHLSHVDLTELKSQQDDVYFQFPFWKIINYSFDSALIISLINFIIFMSIVIWGIKNKGLYVKCSG